MIDALGVPLDAEIATHIYLAILTDTGGFRHSHITPRTFESADALVEAGVDAAALARLVYEQQHHRQAEADWRAPRRRWR